MYTDSYSCMSQVVNYTKYTASSHFSCSGADRRMPGIQLRIGGACQGIFQTATDVSSTGLNEVGPSISS